MGRLLQQPQDLQSMARSKFVAWAVAQRDDMLTYALMELLDKQHKATIRTALTSHIENIQNYLENMNNHIVNSRNYSGNMTNHIVNSRNYSENINNHIVNSRNYSGNMTNHIVNSRNYSGNITNHIVNSRNYSENMNNHIVNSRNYSENMNKHIVNSRNYSENMNNHIVNSQNYLQNMNKGQNNNKSCDYIPTYYSALIEKTVRRIINTLTETSKFTLIQDKLVGFGFNVMEQMIENLFAKHLTKLELTESAFRWCRSILCFKDACPNLVHLTLRMTAGSKHKGSLEADTINMLHNLPHLKYLAFINYCSDAILCQVATNCPSIEELVILNHEAITDESMAIISRLRKLTTVKINEGYVTERGIERLLLKCENLKRIGKFDKISRSLKHIASTDNSGRTFNLEHYSSKGDSVQQLRLVVRLCPKIKNLFVKRAESASVVECRLPNNLPAVNDLTNLSKLCLQNYNFYDDKVTETLQAVGRGLQDLDLQNITDINRNALIYISETCPNLERLSINYCGLKNYTKTSSNKMKKFKKLKEINLDITCYGQRLEAPSKELAHEIAYILLSTCLNVDSVNIGRGVWITERTILKALDNNPMVYLKSLKILDPVGAKAITTAVLDRITKNCINRPEVIIYDNMNLSNSVLQTSIRD